MTPSHGFDKSALYVSVGVGLISAAAILMTFRCCDRKIREFVSKKPWFSSVQSPNAQDFLGCVFQLKGSEKERIEGQKELEALRAKILKDRLSSKQRSNEAVLLSSVNRLTASLKENKRLISGPTALILPNKSPLKIRAIAAEGDCFFLSYTVSLLEFVQKNQSYADIQSVIVADPFLSEEEKEDFIDTMLQAVRFEESQDLEDIFTDNDEMEFCVGILRTLMASAIDDKIDIDVEGKCVSKELIYGEFLGSLSPSIREKAPAFEPRHFKKMQKLLIETDLWPSDTLIKEFFVKMGMGLNMYRYDQKEGVLKPVSFEMKELGVAEIGSVFLAGEHYMNIYPEKQKVTVRCDLIGSS